MANALYQRLFRTVSEYIGEEKAEGSIGRQLTRCDATGADTLNTDHLRELMNFLIGATTLPLHPDKEKKAELPVGRQAQGAGVDGRGHHGLESVESL